MVSDIPRNYFYTLTARNGIAVYRPTTEKSIEHVQTIHNLYKTAQEKAPGSPALTPQYFQVIALHVIEQSESRAGVQLVAITTNGVRLYFSPSSYGFGYSSYSSTSSGTSARPLQLIHVRLPPTNVLHPDELSKPYRPPVATYGAPQIAPQATTRPFIVSALQNSCYFEGLTIAAQPGDTDGTDFILCMSPDLTRIGSLGQHHLTQNHLPAPPQQQQLHLQGQQAVQYGSNPYGGTSVAHRPPLTEDAVILAIAGQTWAMANVPKSSLALGSSTPVPVVTNELAYQFSEDPRQFMILTNAGLTFLVKRRALDYLRAVVEEVQAEGNVQPIIEFRDRFDFRNQKSQCIVSSLNLQLWQGSNMRHASRSCQWEYFSRCR